MGPPTSYQQEDSFVAAGERRLRRPHRHGSPKLREGPRRRASRRPQRTSCAGEGRLASRADMATTLGLFSRPLGLRDADLSGPRYLCGRGVSKNRVTFIDARASERAATAWQSRLACAGRGSMFQTHPSHRVFVSTLPLWTLLCFSLFASILQTLAAHLALHSTVVVRLVVVTRKCLEMLDW